MSHFFFCNFLPHFRASELHLISSVGGTAPVGGRIHSGWPLAGPRGQPEEAGPGARALQSNSELPLHKTRSLAAGRQGDVPFLQQSKEALQRPLKHSESCFLSRPHWGTSWGPLCNLKKPHLPADALFLAHLSQAAWGDGHFLGPCRSWGHACAIHRHQIQGSLKSTLSLKFSDLAVNQNHLGCFLNRQKLWVPPDIVIENQ